MLRLAASLADQALVSLGDAITGIDERNVGLLIKSVRHASGLLSGKSSASSSDCSTIDSNPCSRPVDTLNCSPGR